MVNPFLLAANETQRRERRRPVSQELLSAQRLHGTQQGSDWLLGCSFEKTLLLIARDRAASTVMALADVPRRRLVLATGSTCSGAVSRGLSGRLFGTSV